MTDERVLPELPENDIEMMRDRFPQWMIFETVKPGVREYLCTRCGKRWKHDSRELRMLYTPEDRFWDGVKVNDRVECPECGCVETVKNRKQFKVPWRNHAVVFFLPVSEDYVAARAVMYEKYGDCAKGAENVIRKTVVGEYHIRKGRKTEFFRNGEKAEHITEPFTFWHGIWTEKYGYRTVWDGRKLKREETFLRYFPDAQLQEEYMHEREYPLMKLICAYAEHPMQVETLAKVGVFEAVRALAEGKENVRCMDWSAKTPWEMHKLPKQVYEVWKKDCYQSLDTLKLYRFIGTDGVNGMKAAREIEQDARAFTWKEGLKHCMRIAALGKEYNGKPDGFIRYIEKMTERYKRNACAWGKVSKRAVYETWADYMAIAERMGAADKVPRFPADVKERHDRLLEIWRAEEDKRRREEEKRRKKLKKQQEEAERKEAERRREALEKKHAGVREIYAKIRDKYAFTDGVYSIVVPEGAADIQEEGYNLIHCTGTSERYFARILSGESYIFFLRRADKPEESWYTLEVEPGGTIRQKRTKYDRQEDDLKDAIPFLQKWQEEIAPRMAEEDLAAAMEAKRLRMMEFEELRRNDTRIRNGQLRGKRLADVLSADLMEALYQMKTGGERTEEEREAKNA